MPWTYHNGVYCFSQDTKSIMWVHEMVMGTVPIPGMMVRHKDGDILNNRRENLEWVNPSEPEFVFLTKGQLKKKMDRMKKEYLQEKEVTHKAGICNK